MTNKPSKKAIESASEKLNPFSAKQRIKQAVKHAIPLMHSDSLIRVGDE